MFMNPLGGGTGAGGDGLIVELMAEPDIVLEDENIAVEVQTDIEVTLADDNIEIEVD
jgi:hypothetical protein